MKGLLVRIKGATKVLILGHGKHRSSKGACAMEAASLLAGYKVKTDYPSCVDPHLRGLFIKLNDQWGNEDRQKLWKYVLRSLDTNSDDYRNKVLQQLRRLVDEKTNESHPSWGVNISIVKSHYINKKWIIDLLEIILPESREPDFSQLEWDRLLAEIELEDIEDDFIVTHA